MSGFELTICQSFGCSVLVSGGVTSRLACLLIRDPLERAALLSQGGQEELSTARALREELMRARALRQELQSMRDMQMSTLEILPSSRLSQERMIINPADSRRRGYYFWLRLCVSVCVSVNKISQKLIDGFQPNLVDN